MKPFAKRMNKWARTAAAALAGISIAWSASSAGAASIHIATKTTTFWTLSKYYGLTVQQIANANPNVNPYNIQAGQRLNIPAVASKSMASAQSVSTLAASGVSNSKIIAGGKSYEVVKTVQATATAYTAAASENGWGPVDYFGNSLRVGTVAVDPDLIALGTKLYIVGYDYAGLPVGGMMATALDTGSAIQGNRIDIFVPGTTSQAKSFGIQYVKVYVLR